MSTSIPADDLFEAYFDLSLAGAMLLAPVLDASGAAVDFTYARTNAAARQLLALPEQPTETMLTRFPKAAHIGVLAFYQRAWAAGGELCQAEFSYDHQGTTSTTQLAARRVGQQVLVSLTDTSGQPRSTIEKAAQLARDRAAAETRQQELQGLFEQAPVAIAVFRGPQYVIELANEPHLALWGRTSEQVLGRPLFEALPEAGGQGYEALLAGVLATGQPHVAHEMPARIQRRGSLEEAFFDFVYQPLREPDGRVSGVMAVASEVTERVLGRRQADTMQAALLAAAQRRTQQREELFQVFEQAPAAIMLLREPNHRIEYVNPAYAGLFPGVALRGRLVAEAHPNAAASGNLGHLDRVYATGEAYVGEEQPVALLPVPGQPAQTHYFNFTYQPYREDGRIVGVSVFAYDVTEPVLARRAAARQLQWQQLELQRVFEQAPVGIYLMRGPEFVIEQINATAADMWGTEPARMLGRSWLDIAPGLRGSELLAAWRQVLATGQPHRQHEVRYELRRARRGKPDVGYFTVTYQPWRDGRGEITGIIAVGIEVTEQVLARQAVEQANQELAGQRGELQRVFEQAPAAIAIFRGPRYVIELANAAVCELWGRTPQQALGTPLFELLPEAAGQGFEELLDGVLATGVPFVARELPSFIDRHGRRDTVYWNFVYQRLYEPEHGREAAVLVVATEATEQVLARQVVEQQTQELENRVQERTAEALAARAEAERQRGELERVFEQAPLAIAVYRGPNYTIELANSTVARLWGRTQAQLIGKDLFEALPEVAGMGYEQLLDNVMATGAPYVAHDMEARHERNGHLETVYWDFVYVPTYAADGGINGAMVVATETTAQVLARRQVEQLNQELETRVQERTRQLTEQQTLLRQILGQVPAYIATLSGPEHRFSFFNELYQALVTNRAELGRPVAEALPEVVEQGFIELLDRVYATGEPFVGVDVSILLDDARTGRPRQYYLDFIYQPLFDAQRQVQGILAFVLDVTDRTLARRQVEQGQQRVQELNQELAASNAALLASNAELAASNAELRRTNTDLDTFVYTASHDLKAPITNLEGLLATLRDELPAAGTGSMTAYVLELMDNAVARFLLTIDQLTDVSRLQEAAREPAEPVALAPLLDNLRLDLDPLLASTHGRLVLDVAACPTVVFSPKNLRSILYNLLSNALKYHAPGRSPVVQVRASWAPSHVVLEVTDNGLGLNESQQAKLFTLFQRLHTHVEGSGVGLYMLKRMVENADGTVAVHSEQGAGTTFTVTLPQPA